MAKKQKDKGSGVQNRPAYSRVSFLYQAAALMATTPKVENATTIPTSQAAMATEPMGTFPSRDKPPEHSHPPESRGVGLEHDSNIPSTGNLLGISRRLVTDLRQVGLKTQIRMDPSIKRTLCKFCDTLLIEGESCTSFVENKSTDASKPWADVLIIKCNTCQGEKRFPVAAPRQKRRPLRSKDKKDTIKPQRNTIPNTIMATT